MRKAILDPRSKIPGTFYLGIFDLGSWIHHIQILKFNISIFGSKIQDSCNFVPGNLGSWIHHIEILKFNISIFSYFIIKIMLMYQS